MTIRAVVFDMDGTIVQYPVGVHGSSWDMIFHALKLDEKYQEFLEYYIMKHELYGEWFEKLVALLKGGSVSDVKKLMLPPVYANKASFEETCKRLKEMGISVGIISSGIDLVGSHVAKEFGLDFCITNKITINGDSFDGKGELVVNLWKKDKVLLKLCSDLNIKPKEVAVVGDYSSELPLFKIAGLGFAYSPKDDAIQKAANHIISDFREIIPILKNHH